MLVLAAKLLETKFFVDNDDLHNVHIAHFLVVNGKGVADSIRRGAIITMILFNGTWSLGDCFLFYNYYEVPLHYELDKWRMPNRG